MSGSFERPKNAVPTILLESEVWDAFRKGTWKRPSDLMFLKTWFSNTPYAVD
nr:hypothetical protein [uncultured Chryseobacterium sp.]